MFCVIAICCRSLQADEKGIPITLYSRGVADGIVRTLTSGVPFPDATLQNNASIRLEDPDGSEVPIQIRTSAKWLSGSIRWVLIDTQQSLPKEKAVYCLEWGDGVARRAAAPDRVKVDHGGRSMYVDTGPLQFALSKDNMSIFSEIYVCGADGRMTTFLPAGTRSDLFLEDDKGTVYWGSLATDSDVTIEEHGPLRVLIKLEGWMQSEDGRKLGRRIVRV